MSTTTSTASTGASGPITVRLATLDDAATIMAIYNTEVETQVSTFDLVARTLDEQRRWLAQRSGAFSTVVAVFDDRVVGFVTLAVQGARRLPHDRRGLGLRVAGIRGPASDEPSWTT